MAEGEGRVVRTDPPRWRAVQPSPARGEGERIAFEAIPYHPIDSAEPVENLDKDFPGIVASHTLIPEALHRAFATRTAPGLPLVRRRHEMIATTVSLTNRCRD